MPAHNTFKLGTEIALLLTLVLCVCLKSDLEKEGSSEQQIGVMMLVTNTVLPLSFLAYGLYATAVDYKETHVKKTTQRDMEFDDNPLAVDEEIEFANPATDDDPAKSSPTESSAPLTPLQAAAILKTQAPIASKVAVFESQDDETTNDAFEEEQQSPKADKRKKTRKKK